MSLRNSPFRSLCDEASPAERPEAADHPSSKSAGSVEDNVRAALVENRKGFLLYFRRRLGTTQDAEDALHDFYLRVLESSHQVANPGRLHAWLKRVLRSTLVDRYRRTASRKRLLAEFAVLPAETADEIDVAADCECVDRYLLALKPEFAEVLRRADMLEQPHALIARELGLSVGNVAVRLHRARKALRERLVGLCETCSTQDDGRCRCEPDEPSSRSSNQRGISPDQTKEALRLHPEHARGREGYGGADAQWAVMICTSARPLGCIPAKRGPDPEGLAFATATACAELASRVEPRSPQPSS